MLYAGNRCSTNAKAAHPAIVGRRAMPCLQLGRDKVRLQNRRDGLPTVRIGCVLNTNVKIIEDFEIGLLLCQIDC